MRRTTQARGAVALGAVVALLAGGTAHADNFVANGDQLGLRDNGKIDFGEVCANTTTTKTFPVAVRRASSGDTYNNGAAVTVKVAAVDTSGGRVSTTPTVGGTVGTITMPSNWSTADSGTFSPTVNATVTFKSGAAGTQQAGSVTFSASGPGTKNGSPITASNSQRFDVATQKVVACAPADTTAPTLQLPGTNGVLAAEATGASGAVVTYSATATDQNPANPAVSCSPVSGGTFRLGDTTVSCSATDAAGNRATGTFVVRVRDTTLPTLTGVPSPITAEATSSAGAQVTYTPPTASDTVSGTRPVSCLPASGATFILGSTTVTCSASDAAGNTASSTFGVTVQDTTGPVLSALTPLDAVEASSGDGAVVTYTKPTATDAVSGTRPVTCTPASGSTFALGSTTVDCAASDAAGNRTTASFAVLVQDTTKPVLVLPKDLTAEATSAAGASVQYSATAEDTVDGAVTPTCSPASGGTFRLGDTTVSCSAADRAGNAATGTFAVSVVDTTKPTLNGVPAAITAEATSGAGAAVTFTAPTATDLVDGNVAVSCSRTSGATFALGSSTVTCSATDAAGNTAEAAFAVTVQDTTKPTLSNVPSNVTAEATSAGGAVVSYTKPTANDTVDGALSSTCAPAAGSAFALGNTTVTCSATDAAKNTAEASFVVSVVDTTGPSLALPADRTVAATGPDGAAVSYTATATDLVDPNPTVTCTPASDSTFALGSTTVNCTASDATGNLAKGSFTITVNRTVSGFFRPIDQNRIVNTFKAGQTIPLKFEVFAGTTELTSLDIFKSFSVKTVACDTTAASDVVDIVTTGNTTLRYDTAAGQYIQNWKTPSDAKGKCYQVAVETLDGATQVASFKGM